MFVKNTKMKSFRLPGLLAICLLAFSQGVLSGCGNPVSGDVAQADGSSSISAVFRAFTRPDSSNDTQLPPDVSQPVP
ncbi:MAG: hypothetical protein L0Y56_09140, partial [Nitrospira sp.]|nr:hypothetical protein [Nitrospira sp.]